MNVSFTSADTFQKCQRRFWYEYLDPDRPKERPLVPAMLPGLVHHKALQLMIEKPTLSSHEWVSQAIAEFLPKLVRTGINVDDMFFEVTTTIEKLVRVLPYANTEAVEKKFECTYGRGVIDLIVTATYSDGKWDGGGRTVIDYKVSTGRARSGREAALSPQLALYALAEQTTHAAFVELPRNVDKPVRIVPVTYGADEIESWSRWWGAMAAAINNRQAHTSVYEWPMCDRAHPLCTAQWCPWHDKCYGRINKGS